MCYRFAYIYIFRFIIIIIIIRGIFLDFGFVLLYWRFCCSKNKKKCSYAIKEKDIARQKGKPQRYVNGKMKNQY